MVGCQGSLGVLCPMYSLVRVQEGLGPTHIAQQGRVWLQQALIPLLGEKGRVIQEGKNEGDPVAL